MFDWFKGRSLRAALSDTKMVRVKGVRFKIRKISVLDFLDGSKVLQKSFITYEEKRKAGKRIDQEALAKNIQSHLRDVFLSAVVEPTLTRKQDDGSDAVFVDEIFADMDLANELYNEILIHTYGKKKVTSILQSQKS